MTQWRTVIVLMGLSFWAGWAYAKFPGFFADRARQAAEKAREVKCPAGFTCTPK